MEKLDFSNKLEAVTGEVQDNRTCCNYCRRRFFFSFGNTFFFFSKKAEKKDLKESQEVKNIRAETWGKKIKRNPRQTKETAPQLKCLPGGC